MVLSFDSIGTFREFSRRCCDNTFKPFQALMKMIYFHLSVEKDDYVKRLINPINNIKIGVPNAFIC